ncbi:MAG: hemerythrin domain-containing protein [Acidobacteria bacterium]|nr:hemerythrin domain-containing protein [Acidobacteriota bacterium]
MEETKRAIADELLREHEVERGIVRQLELLVEEGGLVGQESEWGRRMCDELSAFRRHLQRHFALEEEGGFMLEVVARMPQASEQVEKLRQEHGETLKVIDELIHDSSLLAYGTSLSLAELRNRILEVFSTIRRHEAEENELIQQIFYQEVSVAD